MRKNDLITPEGTKDFLFDDCVLIKSVEDRLRRTFNSYGYSEIITPGIEFFDVFNKSVSNLPQESMYKLSDSKGRLIVVRPDSTIPIARVVATRLKNAQMPLRLFYNQSILTNNPTLTGQSDELFQAGIELIGSSSKKADLEIIATAAKILSDFDENTSIEIGDVGIFKSLTSILKLNDTQVENIRKLIESKNYHTLNEFLVQFGDNEYVELLRDLPNIFGGNEIFQRLSKYKLNDELNKRIKYLNELVLELESIGYRNKITLDLGIVTRTDYYTGIVFRGYIKGFGDAILSGGRYDNLTKDFGLDLPAIGFAINVDGLCSILKKNGSELISRNKTLVFGDEKNYAKAILHAQKLSDSGEIVEYSVFNTVQESIQYAKIKGMSKVYIVCDEIEEIIIKETNY